MFKIEIHGYFNSPPSEREARHIDYPVFGDKVKNYFFTTPMQIKDTGKNLVLSFKRNDKSPYLPKGMLEFFLEKFKNQKDKIIIELMFCCTDVNFSTGEKIYLSHNQATMNSFTYQSSIFYNEADDIFYYTYEKGGLHIVWIENTETLLNKVKIIKQYGYKGIFIRDVPLALDGNWEALYKIKKD